MAAVSWTPEFNAALERQRRAPTYLLEVLEVTGAPGASWRIGSHLGLGDVSGLDPSSISWSGASLSPRTVSATLGGWTVDIVRDVEQLYAHATAGSIVALRQGFAGWTADEMEIIGLGQVTQISGQEPRVTVECRDILGAFRSRLSTSYGLSQLFADLSSSTTAAAGFTPGDTQIVVASTAGFSRQTGGTGMLLCTPASGDPFYATYTGVGIGPPRFTGISTGILGTSAVALAIADTVEEVAHVYGHPLDAARKILCSTGAGTNGTYDVLPSGWGLGVPDDLVDHADIDAWRDDVVVPASGNYTWSLVALEPQDDAIGWLSDILAPAGLFLVVRQGKITIRAIQDTETAARVEEDLAITDADVIGDAQGVESYQAWDPGHDPEIQYVRVVAATGLGAASSSTEDAATLPTANTDVISLTAVWDNDTAIATEVLGRLEQSRRRRPELLRLRLARARLARAAVGDIVPIQLSRVLARQSPRVGIDGQALIVDVTPDPVAGTVVVSALVYPREAGEFA